MGQLRLFIWIISLKNRNILYCSMACRWWPGHGCFGNGKYFTISIWFCFFGLKTKEKHGPLRQAHWSVCYCLFWWLFLLLLWELKIPLCLLLFSSVHCNWFYFCYLVRKRKNPVGSTMTSRRTWMNLIPRVELNLLCFSNTFDVVMVPVTFVCFQSEPKEPRLWPTSFRCLNWCHSIIAHWTEMVSLASNQTCFCCSLVEPTVVELLFVCLCSFYTGLPAAEDELLVFIMK